MRQTKKLVIACVGDSITEGIGACPMDTCSYPAVLQQLLGDGCTVKNFGASGMTLLREGDYPYCREPRCAASFAGAPDVVLLMMGTNDAKPQNWRFRAEYSAELVEMIRRYQALPTRPQVFVSTCATVHRPLDGGRDRLRTARGRAVHPAAPGMVVRRGASEQRGLSAARRVFRGGAAAKDPRSARRGRTGVRA